MEYKIVIKCKNKHELENTMQKLSQNPNKNLTEINKDKNNPPTDKQMYYLKVNNLPIPEKITFEQASKIISKHKEEKQ
jgi:hypothetical protein